MFQYECDRCCEWSRISDGISYCAYCGYKFDPDDLVSVRDLYTKALDARKKRTTKAFGIIFTVLIAIFILGFFLSVKNALLCALVSAIALVVFMFWFGIRSNKLFESQIPSNTRALYQYLSD